MSKYLIKAWYNADGAKGLVKEGGSARKAVVQKVVESVGGKLDAFYYAYGDVDVYGIVDLPDETAGLAFSLAVNATGAVKVATIPLIEPETIDAAAKRPIAYRAPGA